MGWLSKLFGKDKKKSGGKKPSKLVRELPEEDDQEQYFREDMSVPERVAAMNIKPGAAKGAIERRDKRAEKAARKAQAEKEKNEKKAALAAKKKEAASPIKPIKTDKPATVAAKAESEVKPIQKAAPAPAAKPAEQKVEQKPTPAAKPIEQKVAQKPAPAAKPVEQKVAQKPAPAAKPAEQKVEQKSAPAAKPIEQKVAQKPAPAAKPVEQKVAQKPAPAAKPVEQKVAQKPAPAAKPTEQKVAQKPAPAAKPVEREEPQTIEATETVKVIESKSGKSGKFDIKKSKDGRYVFNLYASNHVIVATSQIYSSSQSAVNGIRSIIANAKRANLEDQTLKNYKTMPCPKWEMYVDRGGQYRFRLNAPNGSCIVHSQGYTTKSACRKGIDSIIRIADDSEIDKSYLKDLK